MPNPKSPCRPMQLLGTLNSPKPLGFGPMAGFGGRKNTRVGIILSKNKFAMTQVPCKYAHSAQRKQCKAKRVPGHVIQQQKYKKSCIGCEDEQPTPTQRNIVDMAGHNQGGANQDYHSFMSIGDNPAGIIVPQTIYVDRTPFQPDIANVCFPGPLYLHHALIEGYRNTPAYEERPMTSAIGRQRLTLRILWPGYPPWECNINVRERNQDALPIERWLLAKRLADVILRFHQEVFGLPNNTDWAFPKIKFNQLILHELRQVARGSWQAVILYVP